MADNVVSFEITANTQEAGKAILELQRQLNKIANIKSDDAGVKAQQKEFAKINKTLGEIIEKESQRGHHYNTYAANAKKVETLNTALKENEETLAKFSARKAELEQKQAAGTITPSEVNELSRAVATVANLEQKRVQINADITKYTKRNNDLNKSAKAELAGLVQQYGEISADESNALGLKIESTKATQAAAQAEGDLTQKVKKTSDALAESASNAKKANDAIQDRTKQPVTKNATPLDTAAKAIEDIEKTKESEQELRATIIALKADVMSVADAMKMRPANDNIAELIRRYNALRVAKQSVEKMGMPTELDGTYKTLLTLLAQVNQQINEYKRNLLGVDAENKKTSKSIYGLSGAYKQLVSNISSVGLGKAFKSIHGIIKKLHHSFSRLSRDMERGFRNRLRSITKYVLGFRSLFFLVRRLRKYIGEGIQNMAKFNDGNNHVNASITRLLSSLLYLKNAWATAFSPILQFVTPVLEALIDKIAAVGNAFSRFLGTLFGTETVFQAVKVQAQDYADSLDNVGSSAGGAADKAKKLKDRLASFDDLNVLGKDDDNDGSGSGGGGGLADAYTPNPNDMFKIVEAQSELADRIKAVWQQSLDSGDFSIFGEYIGSSIRDGIVSKLQGINWDNAKETASNIGEGAGGFIATLFGTPDLWVTLGHSVGETLNTINTGISSFLDFFEQGKYGKSMGEGLNEFLDTTDFELAGDNINRVFTDVLDNIKDFIDTIDSKEAEDAIHNFIEGLDIPEIVWKIGEVLVEAAKLVINVTAELVVDWAEDYGTDLATDDKTGGYNYFTELYAHGIIMRENYIDTYKEIFARYFGNEGAQGQGRHPESQMIADYYENAWIEGIKSISLSNIGKVISEALGWDNIKKYWDSGAWDKFWTDLETMIWGDENWEGGIAEWLATKLGFGDLYNWAKGGGTDVTTGFWDGIKEGWNNFWDWFTGLFDGLKYWVEECFNMHSPSVVFEGYGINIMDGLWNGLSAAWENVKLFFSNIKTWISDTWTNIKNKTAEVWNNIKDWLSNTWESIKTKVSSTFTVIKSKILYIWESIKEGIKTPINAILGVVESFVNKCIDGINSLIEKLNSIPDIKITNPFNGQEYTLGLNIPTIKNVSIPRLAQGAVIPPNREFMAVLGDQSHGTNIEAPLDTIKQAVAEVLANNGNAEVIQLLQQLIGVVENKELVIGDKEIGKANARYANRQSLIRGTAF